MEIKIDRVQLAKLNKKLSELGAVRKGAVYNNLMHNIGRKVEARLKSNVSNRYLKVRTGNLRSSIGYRVVWSDNAMSAVIGSGVRTGNPVKYARILELGGTIRPKRGKYLTIPIRAGSPEAIGMGLWKTRRGTAKKPISFSSKIISFRKVKQVTIKPKKYIEKTARQMTPIINSIVRATIDMQVNKK